VLAPLAARFGWEVEAIAIDADAILETRSSDRVPVLLFGERELCRSWIDAAAVKAFLVDRGANSR